MFTHAMKMTSASPNTGPSLPGYWHELMIARHEHETNLDGRETIIAILISLN